MGSVPSLYTTGDNDPEIEPVQYYRHYLYCDGCGSFELDPWIQPDNHEKLEKRRRWLGRAAAFAAVLVLVAAWESLGLVFSPLFLMVAVYGISAALLFRVLILSLNAGTWPSSPDQKADPRVARYWRFVKTVLYWMVIVALAQWLASELWYVLWAVAAAGLLLVVVFLVLRHLLGSRIEYAGLRCRQCGVGYRYGTPFFRDLDANPRALTVADVPRPLGSSPFEIGASMGMAPAEAVQSRLPE